MDGNTMREAGEAIRAAPRPGGTTLRMRKERTTIAGGRYLIYYTFEETEENNKPVSSCEHEPETGPGRPSASGKKEGES